MLEMNMSYIIMGMGVLILFMLIYVIILQVKLGKLNKSYARFMEGEDGASLEKTFVSWVDRIRELEFKAEAQRQHGVKLEESQKNCVQKVHIKRYNSFEDMGGDLSFAIALLDDHNDGVLLNIMHSREGTYSYGKQVKKGHCDYNLTNEEIEALQSAIGAKTK